VIALVGIDRQRAVDRIVEVDPVLGDDDAEERVLGVGEDLFVRRDDAGVRRLRQVGRAGVRRRAAVRVRVDVAARDDQNVNEPAATIVIVVVSAPLL
jgi:hypothetical protein